MSSARDRPGRVPRSIAERRVFVDTSAFLALTDRRDEHYPLARAILGRLADGRFHLLTTRYVIVEAHATILRAGGGEVGRSFLRWIRADRITVPPTTTPDERRAEAIIFAYQDKEYSLCDAISFAVMERLGILLAFTFDDHFRQHGFSTPLDRQLWP